MLAVGAFFAAGYLVSAIAAGGRARELAAARIRWESAVLVLFILQALVREEIMPLSPVLVPYAWVALAATLALVLLRQKSRGLRLSGVGALCNAIVVAVNGRMPYVLDDRLRELMTTGVDTPFYVAATNDHLLLVLADVLPTPWQSVASIGDVLLWVGVSVFLAESVTRSAANSCDAAHNELT